MSEVHREMGQKEIQDRNKEKEKREAHIIFFSFVPGRKKFIKLVAAKPGHVEHLHVVTWQHVT
jgi:hypothetical protein